MEITTLTDTITIVNETLNQSDLIDPYKELIEAQRSTYNFLIYIFLGILGLFSFVAGYIYFKKTKDLIKENTKEIFDEERKNIISSIKEEYDNKFKELREEQDKKITHIEATSARLFYHTIKSNAPAEMGWAFISLENYLKINDGFYIRVMTNSILSLCNDLNKDDVLKKKFIGVCKKNLFDIYAFSYEYFSKILERIPDTLTEERNKIRTFFDSIKDEISRGKPRKRAVSSIPKLRPASPKDNTS